MKPICIYHGGCDDGMEKTFTPRADEKLRSVETA